MGIYKIAVIRGDGIGTEVIEEGIKVMSAAQEKFPFQEKQPSGNLTCTFGLATFPQDAKTKELLLKKADECLYLAKSAGKNKLIAYKNNT